ncbi:hypothetical protein VG1_CDS0068 [Arthrobacter phage Cupello]|nr:hypothetical protein VG1_CDS0068 [Arthrobacter phage Cupello]
MLAFIRWFTASGRQPHNFLALLIHARDVQQHEASVSAAFRAGLKVGAEHPEVAAWLKATYEKENNQ